MEVVSTYASMSMWKSEVNLGYPSAGLTHIVLRQDLSREHESWEFASKIKRLLLLQRRNDVYLYHGFCCCGGGGCCCFKQMLGKSGLHVFKTSTFPTELSPQPTAVLFLNSCATPNLETSLFPVLQYEIYLFKTASSSGH